MDNAVDLLRLEQRVHPRLVADVHLIELCLGVHRRAEAGLQVIRHNDLTPRVDQFIHRMRADVTGAAQYQNSHRSICPFLKTRLLAGYDQSTVPPTGRMRSTWQQPAPSAPSTSLRNADRISSGTNA